MLFRSKEAAKLGFASAIVPPGRGRKERGTGDLKGKLQVREIAALADLVPMFADAETGSGV